MACTCSEQGMSEENEDIPSELAGLICSDYRGIKITNNFPAKNSRKIMKRLLQLKPRLFQYEPYAEEIKLKAWVNFVNIPPVYEEGYGNFFDPVTKQFDPDFYSPTDIEKPHILARDLIWRVFNIGELYVAWKNGQKGKKYLELDHDILFATAKAVMKEFSIDKDQWKKKCLPFLNHSINDFFMRKIKKPYFCGFLENQSCMFIDI